ncbi:MAG: hypothetical protein H0V72_04180 [Bradyrhizobium sp.]|nr:hypothetical protein [Bradyrhizobium sp.]
MSLSNDDAPSLYDANFFQQWEAFAEQVQLTFDYGGPDSIEHSIATKQMQYVQASMAVARLLRNIGQREAGGHFHKLAEALQDVVEGINHPLFKVQKLEKPSKRGRQNDTSEIWRIRSFLCIGVQFLIVGGLEQDDAVTLVAQRHRMQLTRLTRPGTNLKSSLPTWLKSFAGDVVTNEAALSSYKVGMRSLDVYKAEKSKNDIRVEGERLVAGAAANASALIRI